jgi:hypothetical protein
MKMSEMKMMSDHLHDLRRLLCLLLFPFVVY